MKKIIFKSGSTMMGGLEKVQIEYINFLLTQKEYEVKVIIENDNGEDNILEKYINTEVNYLKSYENKKRVLKLRNERKRNIWTRIKYNIVLRTEKLYADKKFLEIYSEFQPDIIIDFDSSLTKIINKLGKSKNFVWIHSSVEKWKKKKSKIKRFVHRLNKYDKVICICQEMKEDLLKLSNKLEKKVDYIYNPVNFEKIKELSEENFSVEEEVLANEKFLLTIARFDCVPKDFETLFKAFDLAKEKGYDGKLYVIGDGEDRDKVESFLNDCKYKKDILLLGRKENPYNWLKKADKFILSSRYEGFPTVLIEALVLNKIIFSSNCKTGPKEILAGNFNLLYNIGDFKRLAELIFTEERNDYRIFRFNKNNIFSKLLELLES
nr:glycosyltransferase [Fusobacterium gastrosuis]